MFTQYNQRSAGMGVWFATTAFVIAMLASTPATAAAVQSASKAPQPPTTVLVSPDTALPSSKFQPPTFTPMDSSNLLIARKMDRGNWHYEIHYHYGNQGWQIKLYKATRIRKSQRPPVPRSTLASENPVLQSNVNCLPTMEGGCPLPSGNIGSPPPTEMSPPDHEGGPKSATVTSESVPGYTYNGHCWKLISTWVWVPQHKENGQIVGGHWEQQSYSAKMIPC